MKTKLSKYAPRKGNMRSFIKDDKRSCSESSSVGSIVVESDGSTNQSKSSLIEEEELLESNYKCDSYRALLKVNNTCYEVNLKEKYAVPVPYTRNDESSEVSVARKRKKSTPSICVVNSRYSVVSRVAKSLGWKLVRDSELWNIFWTDSLQGLDMYKDMKRFQKINHFPGMIEICRKDLLARNLNRMLRMFPVDYNFFPKTWCFPADLGEAQNYSRKYKQRTYIIKPDQGAQGRGIWLTKSLKDIKPTERMICQMYINKPLLIDGYKFDLRIYTLVTSVDPLRIFVYNEGLARFATSKYKEPTGHNTSNVYMHLTNYSVNKHSRTFCKDDEAGSKRKFSTLNRTLSTSGYDVENLWNNIDDIIVKTILSAWPMLKHNYHACFPSHDIIQACFEILGFDILIDQNLKPYLLEVNHSPSFHTDEQVDREVKEALIRDSFNILNVSYIDKKKVMSEDKRRVKSRLLQKIRETPKPQNDPIDLISVDCNKKVQLSPNTRQISWEESHLGGFRRVMPAPDCPNKYSAFFIMQNQCSIYSDTAASKMREAASRQLRIDLIEKARKDQKFIQKKLGNLQASVETESTKPTTKKKKDIKKKFGNNWPGGNISDVEERERMMLLSQRDFLIRSSGLIQTIYESFYRHDLLSESDRKKYKGLFDNLEARSKNPLKFEPFQYDYGSNITENNPKLPTISENGCNNDRSDEQNVHQANHHLSSLRIISPLVQYLISTDQKIRTKTNQISF